MEMARNIPAIHANGLQSEKLTVFTRSGAAAGNASIQIGKVCCLLLLRADRLAAPGPGPGPQFHQYFNSIS